MMNESEEHHHEGANMDDKRLITVREEPSSHVKHNVVRFIVEKCPTR